MSIRLPDTRALRRAVGSLAAYETTAAPLARNRHTDALAGHVRALVEENRKLRAELLASREAVELHEGRWDALKLYIGEAG